MKIPSDAIIADEKLTRYLLVPQERNDKSKFLAQAGFTQDNPDDLKTALRRLADEAEAVEDETTEYGTAYLVEGWLEGKDQKLSVVTVWFKRNEGGFYFVTIKPKKGS